MGGAHGRNAASRLCSLVNDTRPIEKGLLLVTLATAPCTLLHRYEVQIVRARVTNATCYIDGRISLINKRSARRPAGRQKIVKNAPGENLAQV